MGPDETVILLESPRRTGLRALIDWTVQKRHPRAAIGGVITTTGIRRLGWYGLTVSGFFAIFALYASAPANADTVLMVGGADVHAFPGAENGVYMPTILGGSLCKGGSGNQCLIVPFSGAAGVLTPDNPQPLDSSVAAAADRLVQQILQTPGRKIAVGYSAGAPVVEEAAARLNKDPNGPPADELSLITVGNINDGLEQMVPPGTYLQSIGYTVQPSTPTKYPKTVVSERNDGLANSVGNPLSHPLEVLKSVSATADSHLGYFSPDIDLADPSYPVTHDGNVTHIVLPGRTDDPTVTPPPGADGNVSTANPLPPWLVDQFIEAAAPTFASTVNNNKDKLVEKLWPVLMEHPEMFNGIPAIASQDNAAVTGVTPGS